ACILQRAADHIKGLQTDKDKLQTQNEQFRILIKSFQIDSTSVLQAQRGLSTTDPDEAVLLLNEKDDEEVSSDLSSKLSNEEQTRLIHDLRKHQAIIQNWHALENVAHYVQVQKEDRHNRGLYVGTSPRHISDTQSYLTVYDNRSSSSRAATSSFSNNNQQNANTLNTNVNHGNVVQQHSIIKSVPDQMQKRSPSDITSPNYTGSRSSPTANSNNNNSNNNNSNNTTTIAPLAPATDTYFILKQHGGPNIPIQRYITNSLDSNSKAENDNGIVIVERCQSRASSMDTTNQQNSSDLTSTMTTIPHNNEQTVSRRNLQTIVEAIRHLEGDNVLDSLTPAEHSYNHHPNELSASSISVMTTPQLNTNTEATHTSPTTNHQQPNQYVYHAHRPVHVYQQHPNYPPSTVGSSSTSLEIPARIQQMLNEQFQQQTTTTVNIINYDQQQQQKHHSVVTSPIFIEGKMQEQHNSPMSPQHRTTVTAPPKKRKFTYTEVDDNEQIQPQHHSNSEQQQSLITNLVLLSSDETAMGNETVGQLVFRHQSRLPSPLLVSHQPRQEQ
ncbi:unnamed protein product, partial [Didymodactylos carnosus]